MRKTYSKSFKRQICLQVLSKEKTVGALSKECGIARPIISRCLAGYKRYGDEAFTGKGNRLPVQAMYYAFEQENKQLISLIGA